MSPHPDYPRTRLFIPQALSAAAEIALDEKRSHYLAHVLRRNEGDSVALFNGSDGEWQAAITAARKKAVTLRVQKPLRAQQHSPDIWLFAAPLKGGKTEWVVEKATELGAAHIGAVATQFTVVDRINAPRLQAIATEAAEQCERMDVPVIAPLVPLAKLLEQWQPARRLIYADESGAGAAAKDALASLAHGSYAILIGPEGGFSTTELHLLRSLPFACAMCMGPRILRADTAAIAALALVQAHLGDWDGKPAFRNQD